MPDLDFEVRPGPTEGRDADSIYFLNELVFDDDKHEAIQYLVDEIMQIKTLGELFDKRDEFVRNVVHLHLLEGDDLRLLEEILENCFTNLHVR